MLIDWFLVVDCNGYIFHHIAALGCNWLIVGVVEHGMMAQPGLGRLNWVVEGFEVGFVVGFVVGVVLDEMAHSVEPLEL